MAHTTTRLLAGGAAALALAGAGLLGTASPAAAHDDLDHFCGFFEVADNGPVTDVVHHAVEPVGPVIGADLHPTSCELAKVDQPLTLLLTPQGLADSVEALRTLLGL